MLKSDFYYDLPPELIAQTPLENRDNSRLLCVSRDVCTDNNACKKSKPANIFNHRRFFELPDLLNSGDCLVLNDSRVLPARLIGHRVSGNANNKDGSAPIEILLLQPIGGQHAHRWSCLVRPGRKVKTGTALNFGGGELTATVIDVCADGNRIADFRCEGDFSETINRLGSMPLPPYIHQDLSDAERYQTVYSRVPGSAAAPTAGLHFTDVLLETLKDKGIIIAKITLHVGPGTFRPVKTERVEDHHMHSEVYNISEQASDTINTARKNGGRVIAVGTTACRTLETVSDSSGMVSPQSGSTDIFIYPGYSFKCIDGLITNFHLPGSTLIMLVSAFLGRGRTMEAYKEAIRNKYRFYSFGDAMMII